MEKPIEPQGKYFLRSLHEEIDLFDRKLAHLAKHESFATEQERETAIGKMNTKRAKLVKAAQKLAGDGVEFSASELPRSLRPEVVTPEEAAVA